jgi:hypothetical protein
MRIWVQVQYKIDVEFVGTDICGVISPHEMIFPPFSIGIIFNRTGNSYTLIGIR